MTSASKIRKALPYHSAMPLLSVAITVLLAVEEHGGEVKPLEAKSILVMLAIIVVIAFAIVLAGFGYFSPNRDGD